MQIDVSQTINNFDGTPFPLNPGDPDGPKMTFADVMITALMAQAVPPRTYTPSQHVLRYDKAMEVYRAQHSPNDNSNVEISAEVAAMIKEDIARIYGPMVVGQLSKKLDGQ
jgi:hypothetical protein